MERQEVLERVLTFLSGLFGDKEAGIAESTRLGDTVMLDSLATMEVVMFLEEQFELSLDRADLDQLTTPAGITDLILRKRQNG
jgi:acyl carrier protein